MGPSLSVDSASGTSGLMRLNFLCEQDIEGGGGLLVSPPALS